MELREHPLMSYGGVRNWPPVWTQGYMTGLKTLRGEVGILKHAITHPQISAHCFLVIEHEDELYTGCLIFDDAAFCQQICRLLELYAGSLIKEIGDLDLAYTL